MIYEGKWCGHEKTPAPCKCGSSDLRNECSGSVYQIVCNSCDYWGPSTEDDGIDAPTDSVLLWNEERVKDS